MPGFYAKRGLDVSVHPKYKSHYDLDSFDNEYAKDIPQQLEGSLNCGVFVSSYAEYLSYGNDIPTNPFDTEPMHIRYATLLWDYVNRKIQFDAISDSEAPQKPTRNRSDVDSSERITIH
ncbi:hypothetical protein KY285_025865 [Solanum tuberosum]|nr:hypothetical protein KY285_025865 [Solanum tuberosum]